LRDAAQPPEGVPEASSEHVALIHRWYDERLKGRNRKAEQTDLQSTLI
jgi:hypothetical protein